MLKTFLRKRLPLFLVVSVCAVSAATLSGNPEADGVPRTASPSALHVPKDKAVFAYARAVRHTDKSELRALESGKWKKGIEAFRQGDMHTASANFTALLSESGEELSDADKAAVAFWAYRSCLASGDSESAARYLTAAASSIPNFYSIVARHISGKDAIAPDVQVSMAIEYATHKGVAATLYPMPHWAPASGYKLEPALLYAIMRQESEFNPHALSESGAVGVMQLMPDTAHAMARKIRVKGPIGEPSISMALGQHYIQRLMDTGSIGDNLVFVLAAYNAGPVALQKWQDSIAYNNDPFLFIESIPYGGTRDYVVNVIGNYWVYAQLFGSDTPALGRIAQGDWPRYVQDRKQAVIGLE